MSPADPAPTRAHALRNREKLLTTARAAFADADGPVSLEGIARRAGVGIGTLYRHFPTREALVEAVYAAELDDLSAAVATLLDQFPPEVALRAWLDRYARFTVTKRGMLDTLRAGAAAGRIAPQSRDRVATAIRTFLARAAQTGTLRTDVNPEDITTMLYGVFLATGEQADRMPRLLDLLVDALAPRAGTDPRP